MSRAELSPPRRVRFGTVVVVALLHVLAVIGLVRAFAPEFTGQIMDDVAAALTVTVLTPTPNPTPTSPPEPAPEPAMPDEQGAAAAPGKKAKPKEVAAPKPRIVLAEPVAPPVASTGDDLRSGALDRGEGTGAGGEGQGTGSGNAGQGQGGGGVAQKAVKIAGEIRSAKDYPRKTRDLRIGDDVVIVLTVGTDGRVKDCRVQKPSKDSRSDQITCELATRRFRFRPALDARGEPVESVYGWRQRWFYREDRDDR